MLDSTEDKIIRLLDISKEQYYQLVLVVGESGTGKTSVVRRVSKLHNTVPINVGEHLSKELIELTKKQRQLRLTEILEQIVNDTVGTEELIFLDNVEILFDVSLGQDPLYILKRLSRNLTIVSSWSGTFDRGKLTYAESGHDEYRSYDLTEVMVVSMNGESTVDFEHLVDGG